MSKGKYVYVPKSTLALPVSSGYFKVYKDYWWLARGDDLVFYEDLRWPQANHAEATARYLNRRLHLDHCSTVQIPFIYTPLNLKDFM